MTIPTPYVLFLGDSDTDLAVKTARGIYQWRPESVLAEVLAEGSNRSVGAPCMSVAEAAGAGAKTLIIGMSNSGGTMDGRWLPYLLEALDSGLHIASGLHTELSGIDVLAEKARRCDRRLIDIRHTDRSFPTGKGTPRSGRRLLTVGTDCSVGKMYTSLAIHRAMVAAGVKATFRATGQTGIFIAGEGICVDAVISDFISGAVEVLTPDHDADHWDIIEGQGSLFNPSFAGVSLGLLHGAQPDALVMCHEWGRETIKDLPGFAVPALETCIERNLEAARLTNSAVKLVGISLNCRKVSDRQRAMAQIDRLQEHFSVPCFDPMITGVETLIDPLCKPNLT